MVNFDSRTAFHCLAVFWRSACLQNVRMPDDHAYPFVQALGSNKVAEVERLLQSGRSVSERFAFGLTPLHVAAQHGAADCVSLLLERGAEREAHDEMRSQNPRSCLRAVTPFGDGHFTVPEAGPAAARCLSGKTSRH